ncbi:MAG: diguanylate cyclase [Calditrichaeota bacterium]|nr:diguanylate cyclase [Calditrichota bacterium]
MTHSISNIQKKIEELEDKFAEIESINNLLTHQIKELLRLYNALQLLNGVFDIKDFIRAIRKLFLEFFQTEDFAFFVFEERQHWLLVKYSNGFAKRRLREIFYKPGEGFVGQAYLQNQMIYVPDISQARPGAFLGLPGMARGCLLYLPLAHGDQPPLGVLKLHKTRVNGFSDADRNVLSQLTEPITITMLRSERVDMLNRQSWRDPLTNMFRRHTLSLLLEAEFRRSQRFQHPLSLLSVRIENFGKIVQIYRSAFRDAILKQVSGYLNQNTRLFDIPVHYDNNIFLLLLPETTKKDACALAEKIKLDLEAMEFTHKKAGPIKLAVSTNVATYPTDTIEPPLLVKLALSNLIASSP